MQQSAVVRVKRFGLTLVELLVVIAIIGVLMALLFPAVKAVRSAAARVKCANNLRQIGIALHNYDTIAERFPISGKYPVGALANDVYSIQARLLPFLEEGNLYSKIDLDEVPANQPDVIKQRIAVYMCPSELNDRSRVVPPLVKYPLNYAANLGTWLIYDPQTGEGGDGAFPINRASAPSDILDGLSHTIAFSEVKTFQTYLRNGGNPGALAAAPPVDPAAAAALGGGLRVGVGHTEWTDSPIHQSGFSFVFKPNTMVPLVSGSTTYDVDVVSSVEGTSATRPTYAVVTARSYHPGKIVNSLKLDGSVAPTSPDIDLDLWRALGTRGGREVALP